MDAGVLEKVEQQRSELEANITLLKESLRYWQTLEIEYEGLREEFHILPAEATPDECLKAARDLGLELVDEAELTSLVRDQGSQRPPQQIAELLSKRIEYVSRNVATIRTQSNEAGKKRNAMLLAEDDVFREEAGKPLTEIIEELDEDGKILSSRLETRDSVAPRLTEVLKLAGVTDVIETNGTVTVDGGADDVPQAVNEAQSNRRQHQSPPNEYLVDQSRSITDPALSVPPEGTTDNAGLDGETRPQLMDEIQASTSEPTTRSDLAHRTPNQEAYINMNPRDTEDDAALRQEMIDYNLEEIGTIVAELDLAEDAADFSYDEEDDSEILADSGDDRDDYSTENEEEESEDEKGMAKSPVISQAYRRKMEQLQKKLGINGLQNIGPSPELPPVVKDQLDRPSAAEAARNAAINRSQASGKASEEKDNMAKLTGKGRKTKKRVSFADDLEIATDSGAGAKPDAAGISSTLRQMSTPLGNDVVEQLQPLSTKRTMHADPTKGTSRFESAQMNTGSPEPDVTSPADRSPKIVVDNLIERPTSTTPAKPPTSEDLENDLDQRKLADDYYRLRNKMILRQGGFVNGGEDDNYGEAIAPVPEVDEVTGKSRKVSRFKAARLK